MVPCQDIEVLSVQMVSEISGDSYDWNMMHGHQYMVPVASGIYSSDQTQSVAGPTETTPDQNTTVAAGEAFWVDITAIGGGGTINAWGYTVKYKQLVI
jgi:hypothetical protein